MRLILALAIAASAGPAFAQDTQRYTMERTADGYVRMDSQTGEMSICLEQSGQLVCKLAADDRQAYESDIDRLTTRIDRLEQRLGVLEGKAPAVTEQLPPEETFEQSLNYMERFFRRFMGIVKDFEREQETPPQTPDSPQRT